MSRLTTARNKLERNNDEKKAIRSADFPRGRDDDHDDDHHDDHDDDRHDDHDDDHHHHDGGTATTKTTTRASETETTTTRTTTATATTKATIPSVDYGDPSTIAQNIIGGGSHEDDYHHHCFEGPYGRKPIVYADSTASGKSVEFIERYIHDVVLPFYANTHTEASSTGRQTSRFRDEAREFIRGAVHAPASDYSVIFTGSGSTAAIDKMGRVLGISHLAPIPKNPKKRPVVFVGPHEHHSNELPWRESQADCVVIPEDPQTGLMDLHVLQNELKRHMNRPLRIGSFSAASNVTGIRADTKMVTRILHRYGALAFWDYAAAAPHVPMDVAGHDLDAVYISVHKFVGGPGTPGLLVAKSHLFEDYADIPTVPGGGTVSYVQPHSHRYVNEIEHREEGGTPAIVESIRAGLVFRLHDTVGPTKIESLERSFLTKALNSWRQNPNLVLLGNPNATDRIPIVSFLVKAPSTTTTSSSAAAAAEKEEENGTKNETSPRMFLHHNFIVAVLNDLFGIQARGGCSCAGPYGHLLLGIDEADSDAIIHDIQRHGDIVKPGWTRLAFSYYFSNETVDYIIDAVHLVADMSYKLLPWYRFDPTTTLWTHIEETAHRQHQQQLPKRGGGGGGSGGSAMSLWDFSFAAGTRLGYVEPPVQPFRKNLQATLEEGRLVLTHTMQPPAMKAKKRRAWNASLRFRRCSSSTGGEHDEVTMMNAAEAVQLPPSSEKLRWFMLSEEAAEIIIIQQQQKQMQEGEGGGKQGEGGRGVEGREPAAEKQWKKPVHETRKARPSPRRQFSLNPPLSSSSLLSLRTTPMASSQGFLLQEERTMDGTFPSAAMTKGNSAPGRLLSKMIQHRCNDCDAAAAATTTTTKGSFSSTRTRNKNDQRNDERTGVGTSNKGNKGEVAASTGGRRSGKAGTALRRWLIRRLRSTRLGHYRRRLTNHEYDSNMTQTTTNASAASVASKKPTRPPQKLKKAIISGTGQK